MIFKDIKDHRTVTVYKDEFTMEHRPWDAIGWIHKRTVQDEKWLFVGGPQEISLDNLNEIVLKLKELNKVG